MKLACGKRGVKDTKGVLITVITSGLYLFAGLAVAVVLEKTKSMESIVQAVPGLRRVPERQLLAAMATGLAVSAMLTTVTMFWRLRGAKRERRLAVDCQPR